MQTRYCTGERFEAPPSTPILEQTAKRKTGVSLRNSPRHGHDLDAGGMFRNVQVHGLDAKVSQGFERMNPEKPIKTGCWMLRNADICRRLPDVLEVAHRLNANKC